MQSIFLMDEAWK